MHLGCSYKPLGWLSQNLDGKQIDFRLAGDIFLETNRFGQPCTCHIFLILLVRE